MLWITLPLLVNCIGRSPMQGKLGLILRGLCPTGIFLEHSSLFSGSPSNGHFSSRVVAILWWTILEALGALFFPGRQRLQWWPSWISPGVSPSHVGWVFHDFWTDWRVSHISSLPPLLCGWLPVWPNKPAKPADMSSLVWRLTPPVMTVESRIHWFTDPPGFPTYGSMN